MPSVLSILLATYFAPIDEPIETQAYRLRLYAAALLVHIINHFAEFYPTLKSRVVATLVQALLLHVDDGTAKQVPDASGSLDAKLGALMGLRRLGPSSFKTLLGPVPVQSADAAHTELIPLRVMGTWLAENQDTTKRIMQEITAGLRELDTDVAEPDPEAVKAAYGAFWTDVLDKELVAVLAHYHTLIAS